MLADCRWNCTRRMGIGDKAVVVGALQELKRGGVDVAARWNEADGWLFEAGFIRQWQEGEETDGRNYLPMRDHCMAVPQGETLATVEAIDEAAPHPIWRVLWGMGLEGYADETKPRLHLVGNTWGGAGAIWFPIEVSRGGDAVPMEFWDWAVRTMSRRWGRVTMACAHGEEERCRAIRSQLSREGREAVEECPWAGKRPADMLYRVSTADAVLTGNSGALWLSIGVNTPVWCIQRRQEIPHGKMWQARCWPGLRIFVTTI